MHGAANAGPPPALPPAGGRTGAVAWVRANLFDTWYNGLLTLLIAWALAEAAPRLLAWALLDGVFAAADPGLCRQAAGACWAVIPEKYRVALFGTYPFEEQWRGALVVLLVVAVMLASAWPRLWSPALVGVWGLTAALVFLLMGGGVLGLSQVPTDRWGGLPLTLILFVGTVAGGLPLAVVLALGRRSSLPAIKAVCVGFIEVIRGVPLVSVLFIASLMFPLFMPEGVNLDKILRAQIGMILFFAAYAAEVVRGGLQAIPRGQHEAAESLGIGYWHKTTRIVLPQALRIVIPALVNDILRAFKNTSLLLVIGLFDLMGATAAAIADPLWLNYYVEAYLFVAAIYFVFCFSMSEYSRALERRLGEGRNF